MNSLVEMFSYAFMVRALVVGVLISFSAALVGTPLVLRKNSMLSDGLSHVAFGAFALASVLGFAPIWVAIPIVILASFFVLKLNDNSKIHGDSAIALMSASALAIGTFIVSLAGSNVDINSYLFGSILSVGDSEILLALGLLAMIIIIYVVFHNKIFALTFDEKFARAIGINTRILNAIFAILCSVLIVLGMRLVGALLISSLIIFPTLSAQTIFKSFWKVTIAGAILAVVNFVVGLIISYLLRTPTGATVVIMNLVTLIILKVLRQVIK
ncbi:MAG: metal ABC transporter permease [Candidatus Saccharibacteria bacterium]|nr:metal ABC transporter permease [Candidatus Saccharibacteria bacterium]